MKVLANDWECQKRAISASLAAIAKMRKKKFFFEWAPIFFKIENSKIYPTSSVVVHKTSL